MAEYTKEDKESFRKRDLLMAKESAIKAASTIMEGSGVEVKDLLEYANQIQTWLWSGQGDEVKTVTPVTQGAKVEYPKPTLDQLKILNAICERIGKNLDYVCPKVLSWSKTVSKDGKETYPCKEQSIEKFIKYIEENK